MVTASQSPSLLLAKSASPSAYSTVGQPIAYSYVVTNDGNVWLRTRVTFSDVKTTDTCPSVSSVGNNDGLLDPGESLTCSATYLITQADLNSVSVNNTATAQADALSLHDALPILTASQSPSLLLAKSASPSAYSTVGQPIAYSYVVTNDG